MQFDWLQRNCCDFCSCSAIPLQFLLLLCCTFSATSLDLFLILLRDDIVELRFFRRMEDFSQSFSLLEINFLKSIEKLFRTIFCNVLLLCYPLPKLFHRSCTKIFTGKRPAWKKTNHFHSRFLFCPDYAAGGFCSPAVSQHFLMAFEITHQHPGTLNNCCSNCNGKIWVDL